MNKYISIILFTFLLSGSSFAQVNNTKARNILEKIAKKAKTYQNMKFDYTYRMIDKAHDVDNQLKGTIVMEGDNYNLHMMGRNVVSNGKIVWTQDPDAEEIQINTADPSKNAFSFLKLLTTVNNDYSAKLISTKKEKGRTYYIIDLKPNKTQSYYKVRLKIDKTNNWVTEATIYEKNNTEYIFTVVHFSSNLKLPKNYFVINPKDFPDYDVVDLR